MVCRRNPVHCIVPPVLLERIATKGTEEQRERALKTIMKDHSLRTVRLQTELTGGLASQRASLLTAETAGQPQRTICDAGGTENVEGTVVRVEGDAPTGDAAVDEAYDGLGDTYRLLWEVFERDSIDDEGLPLKGVVHYGERYGNAFWDGQRMVFGDGDDDLFNRFTLSLDVLGHELAHGVVQDEAGLNYWQQSGALNESLADVFGSLVKQFKLGQTAAEADWLIGAELLGPNVTGKAIRSMKEPGTAYDDDVLGKDPQPAHMDDYVETTSDNGGVHTNSGIPNRAFYLAAAELGGHSWEDAGWIWYAALRDYRLQPTARFKTFARATHRAAKKMYGDKSKEAGVVAKAWDGVGISLT